MSRLVARRSPKKLDGLSWGRFPMGLFGFVYRLLPRDRSCVAHVVSLNFYHGDARRSMIVALRVALPRLRVQVNDFETTLIGGVSAISLIRSTCRDHLRRHFGQTRRLAAKRHAVCTPRVIHREVCTNQYPCQPLSAFDHTFGGDTSKGTHQRVDAVHIHDTTRSVAEYSWAEVFGEVEERSHGHWIELLHGGKYRSPSRSIQELLSCVLDCHTDMQELSFQGGLSYVHLREGLDFHFASAIDLRHYPDHQSNNGCRTCSDGRCPTCRLWCPEKRYPQDCNCKSSSAPEAKGCQKPWANQKLNNPSLSHLCTPDLHADSVMNYVRPRHPTHAIKRSLVSGTPQGDSRKESVRRTTRAVPSRDATKLASLATIKPPLHRRTRLRPDSEHKDCPHG